MKKQIYKTNCLSSLFKNTEVKESLSKFLKKSVITKETGKYKSMILKNVSYLVNTWD